MKRFTLMMTALAIMSAHVGYGQEMGEIELKGGGRASGGYAEKKFKKAPRKVYIEEFRINYQLLYTDAESTRGGRTMGGGYQSSTQASVAVGIQSVTADDLKGLTNRLYEDYISQWQNMGYEIVTADIAASTEYFSGWDKTTGGNLSEAQKIGYTTATPNGFEYFVKKMSNKGKEKGNFLDKSHKLSYELGGAVVVRVNVTVPFMEDGESQGSKALTGVLGGVSKVVARPNFNISETSMASYKYATKKIAADAVAFSKLKNSLQINGVFEDKKYKAVSTADANQNWNNSAFVTVWNQSTENVQVADCDPEKYKSGVLEGISQYLTASVNQYKSYTE